MGAESTPSGLPSDLSGLCLAITEHAPLPIATVDGATHIVRYANPAFCLLMGQPLERLVGRPLHELLPARDECVTLLDRVFRTGKPERHTEKEEGEPHPVFWSYTMWPVQADEQFVGIMIEVTETAHFHETTLAVNEALLLGSVRQHVLTGAAEDLNARLREEIEAREVATTELAQKARELAEKARLLDLTLDAIIVRDMEGHIRYWNHGAEELYGWSREEALGKVSHLLLQTEFSIPVEQMTAELHRTDHWVGELIHTARDGRRLTVLARKTLDRDSEGHPAAVVESLTDITARKQAEAALTASEERFRALADAIPQLAWTAHPDGFIHWYNRRWYEYTGTTPQDMEGWGWQSVHDPEVLPKVLELWNACLVSGETFELVFPLRGADGQFRAFLTRVLPLKDGAGRVTQWFGTNTDVDELKRTQEALARHTEELACADRRKDEFLAMLAHELRNPLAPLRNASEILKAANTSAAERDEAQRILGRQIENMAHMIDDLLDVSRITEGKIELRCQPVALAEILTATADLARPGIEARGQEFVITLPAEPIFLHADATRLDQVFGNLLTNACKYSDPGSRISLSAERAPAEKPPQVIVRVRDNGIGIAPEMLPRIFDLFVQATRSLDRAHGGLGIGLTLVQRLVKLHGGSVEAHSEGLGQGSEFIVRLPIIPSPVAAPAPLPAPPVRDTPRRILIVDDNEDSARSLATLHRLRGHDTRTAFTGPAALAAAAEFTPEVVLLDIGLPGMDGYEVARRLRAVPALAGAFLVAMSGYGSPDDLARARAAGFDEYLVKPADLDLLRTWLRQRG